MSHNLRIPLAIIASAAAGAALWWTLRPAEMPVPPPPQVRAVTVEPLPLPEPPPAEPSQATPTLVEVASLKIDRRIDALARELSHMWTRNPEELVTVIDDAVQNDPGSTSVTLLLAIAHAETNGHILDVSEAGAVGLAQATPIACRQEQFEGPLFVTRDYLIGARAYILKKPLGDADTIASLVVAKDNPKTRAKAKTLLQSARDLRREGIDELDLLKPYASKKYFAGIESMDEHNVDVLKKLGKLLSHGSRAELRTFRDDARHEYRALKQTQLASWKRYQDDLIEKRDRMIEDHFGMRASYVKKNMPYAASDYLGAALDERFSARKMAAFLVRHLDRKATEARKLARSPSKIEEMTAALYNGGSHNVKRMLAGLIGSLPETERYMKKVPATRRRLDAVIPREARKEPVSKVAR